LTLAPWLRERAAMQADWAAAQGAVLSIDCAETLHAWADVEALRRIIDNLLANALHYAPGPIALQAALTPDAAWVRLEVLDRGPGIPAEHQEAMFAPFARMDVARSPQTGGGSGLGLAIARQLAQQHGWRIGLESRAGGGLLAWVQLPAHQSAGSMPLVS
jgi:two-component system osmolarity sensor histidine kinase EnvZ